MVGLPRVLNCGGFMYVVMIHVVVLPRKAHGLYWCLVPFPFKG